MPSLFLSKKATCLCKKLSSSGTNFTPKKKKQKRFKKSIVLRVQMHNHKLEVENVNAGKSTRGSHYRSDSKKEMVEREDEEQKKVKRE